MKTLTKKEKGIWNAAVLATCKELMNYDGLVPDDRDRKVLSNTLKERISYKHANSIVPGNVITEAINKWIEAQPRDRRTKPFMINHKGKAHSLNDMHGEIIAGTKEGFEMEKRIIMSAIKLMNNE